MPSNLYLAISFASPQALLRMNCFDNKTRPSVPNSYLRVIGLECVKMENWRSATNKSNLVYSYKVIMEGRPVS